MPESTDYDFWVKSAARAAVAVSATLLLVKLVAWQLTNSASMLATLTDSLLDLFASASNLLILRIALQPADKEHRFGHGKAEALAGLAQGAFITGSAVLLLLYSSKRLLDGDSVSAPEVGVVAIVITIVLSMALVLFQEWVVDKTGSLAISADSIHYRSDLLLNISVLLALGLSWLGIQMADSAFAIIIAFYLAYCAFKVMRNSLDQLMDHELEDELKAEIKRLALDQDKVLGTHALRTRRAGKMVFVQLHLELDDNLSLAEAHQVSVNVEQALCDYLGDADIIIHQDPASAVVREKH